MYKWLYIRIKKNSYYWHFSLALHTVATNAPNTPRSPVEKNFFSVL